MRRQAPEANGSCRRTSRSSNAAAPTSFRGTPRAHSAWLRDSPTFVAGLNLLDDGLTALLPVFAQTWFFVLRKRAANAYGGRLLAPPRTPAILHMRSVPQRKRDPTRDVINAPKPSAEIP